MEEEKTEVIEHTTSETVKEMDEGSEVENMKKVEAALFIAGRFMTLQDLVMLTDINPLMLKELLGRLVEKYNQDDSGIEIVVKENTWKMDVRQEYVNMINKLATGSAEFTKSEQETLAVIAYKQPVKQSIIIKIRGNKAYEHVKKFIENELVIGKKMGHTKELRLSDDFFEYFHLRDKKLEKIDNSDNLSSNSNKDNGEKEMIKVIKNSSKKSIIDNEKEHEDTDKKDNIDKENQEKGKEVIGDKKF